MTPDDPAKYGIGGQPILLRGNDAETGDLIVHRNPAGVNRSVWKPSFEELQALMDGAPVHLSVYSPGPSQYPVMVNVLMSSEFGGNE